MKATSDIETKPAYGVGEWAKASVNIQDGCENDCRYCYAKCMAVRFGRKTSTSWCNTTIRMEALCKTYRKRDGRIMFPTSHDITIDNLDACLYVLWKMLAAGNEVLIVSKPHPLCIKELCAEFQDYKNQILFRFTIGSADDSVLRFWEPNAPTFEERLSALRLAYQQGYQTSISCEPMLDTHIDMVVQAAKPYVTDAIWLGRVNRLRQTIAITCPDDVETKERAEQLLAEQPDEFLRELYKRFKDDPKIKFKDSIKEAVGLERPTEVGLDI